MIVKIPGISIRAIGASVPFRQLIFAETPETARITRATGIHSVRVVGEQQSSESLSLSAARDVLDAVNLTGESVDALVWVSQSPERNMPYGAARLANQLNLKTQAVVFDLASGCAGYIQGLFQASLLIQSGAAQKVLVLAGEANSRLIHPGDQSLAMLFGDAGTATLLEAGNQELTFALHHDGSGEPALCSGEDGKLRMEGMEVFQFSIHRVPELLQELCDFEGRELKSIPLFALHQANAFILQYIAKKLGLNQEQIPFEADGYGNTGPASIPLLLSTHAQKVKLPDKAILAGFGIGLQWGGILANLSGTLVLPVRIVDGR